MNIKLCVYIIAIIPYAESLGNQEKNNTTTTLLNLHNNSSKEIKVGIYSPNGYHKYARHFITTLLPKEKLKTPLIIPKKSFLLAGSVVNFSGLHPKCEMIGYKLTSYKQTNKIAIINHMYQKNPDAHATPKNCFIDSNIKVANSPLTLKQLCMEYVCKYNKISKEYDQNIPQEIHDEFVNHNNLFKAS